MLSDIQETFNKKTKTVEGGMGCPELVCPYNFETKSGMEAGLNAAKMVLLTEVPRLLALKNTMDKKVWIDNTQKALEGLLDNCKEPDDDYDDWVIGYNTAIDDLIEKIPLFVENL